MEDEELVDKSSAEPHIRFLSISQAILVVMCLFVLQVAVTFIVAKYKHPSFQDTGWVNIVIAHTISGLGAAQLGASLAGLSLIGLIKPTMVKLGGLISVIVGILGVSILSSEFSNFLQSIKPISHEYVQTFDELTKQNPFGVLLAIAIVAPVLEELVFRGVIFEGIRLRYSLSTAILISTLLFSLVHVLPWLVLNAYILGLFFVWLKIETDSLALCMVAHGLYNSMPILFSRIFSVEIPGFTTGSENVHFQPAWFDVLGLFLLIIGVVGIRIFYEGHRASSDDADSHKEIV